MKYNVTFTKYYNYIVEAEDEEEAEDLARDEFYKDMYKPIREDELDIEEVEED